MSTFLKKYRVALIAGAMTLCMTAGLGAGIHWSGKHAQETVVQAADAERAAAADTGQNMERFLLPAYLDENNLYKDVVNVEIAREVCSKYNLDYDTVLEKDITREMRHYEEALWLIKDMGDCPLLDQGAEINRALSSLEGYICDIYAFDEGADVIKRMCEEFEIDSDTAKIADLTANQLEKIGEEAYNTSDHPKE